MTTTIDTSAGSININLAEGDFLASVWLTMRWHDDDHKQLKSTGSMLGDHKIWEWQWFYPDGTMSAKKNYDRYTGDFDGEFTTWYSNGQMESHGSYTKGVKTREWEYWNEDGTASRVVDQ